MRIVRDSTGMANADLWFEVKPDRFICASNIQEAMRFFQDKYSGLTLDDVQLRYGECTLVSQDSNYTG